MSVCCDLVLEALGGDGGAPLEVSRDAPVLEPVADPARRGLDAVARPGHRKRCEASRRGIGGVVVYVEVA
jgi:hypothetical protein